MMCVADDGKCGRDSIARGLCGKHYQRWSKTGDPQGIKPNPGNRTPRPVLTERTCRVCGFTGPLDKFMKKTNFCRPCSTAYKAEWIRKNPEKQKIYIANGAEWRRRYEHRRRAVRNGQDPDFMEAYVAVHDGKCALCEGRYPPGKKGLAIDHDHRTGAFRGLLCANCNGGLGRFHDDPELLAAAIRYLQSPPVTPADLARLLEVKP